VPVSDPTEADRRSDPVRWTLECLSAGRRNWRVPVRRPAFYIGRHPELDLTLNVEAVSKRHAEIRFEDHTPHLKDLGSTNGSFVNQERVSEVALHDGDILSFGGVEFRLGRLDVGEGLSKTTAAILDPEQSAMTAGYFLTLMDRRAVTSVFQPIIELSTEAVVAHEALGRGVQEGLPESPLELFGLAGAMGQEATLSRLFRQKAAELLAGGGAVRSVFMNAHASEHDVRVLVESMAEVRELLPDNTLVLEVHEGSIAELDAIAHLRSGLSELSVGLAYDDFGSGQARLMELAEVPPDWLKFDMRLIRGIDSAPESRVRLVRSLVATAGEAGVNTVAEGIETPAEAAVCRDVGFSHAQGYLFRRPAALDEL
jgi:EAL domain-containing protein (putative c-di-GMP-specific phosphodiesterase class I)